MVQNVVRLARPYPREYDIITPNRSLYPNNTNEIACPICDDKMHNTIIPTAEGYEFLTRFRNDGDFSDCVETQQQVPVGHMVHLESSVHLQSAHEQFCNILYT